MLAWTILGALAIFGRAAGGDSTDEKIIHRFETMVQYNLDNPHVLPTSQIDSLMSAFAGENLGERIASWAQVFLQDGRCRYLYGRDPGGYVEDGRLCDDFHTDCVLFFYRVTELGRSSSAREAVQFAFGTRFYGANVEDAILSDGRVRYDHGSHLDYSEDILKSGIWGKVITDSIGPAVGDVGNERFPAGSLSYVPKDKINYAALRSGDIAFFILDEKTAKGAEARAQGILIQHLGILKREGDRIDLIHAAKSGLAGLYEGGTVVEVPLTTYLERVDSFKGIAVSRVEEF